MAIGTLPGAPSVVDLSERITCGSTTVACPPSLGSICGEETLGAEGGGAASGAEDLDGSGPVAERAEDRWDNDSHYATDPEVNASAPADRGTPAPGRSASHRVLSLGRANMKFGYGDVVS